MCLIARTMGPFWLWKSANLSIHYVCYNQRKTVLSGDIAANTVKGYLKFEYANEVTRWLPKTCQPIFFVILRSKLPYKSAFAKIYLKCSRNYIRTCTKWNNWNLNMLIRYQDGHQKHANPFFGNLWVQIILNSAFAKIYFKYSRVT